MHPSPLCSRCDDVRRKTYILLSIYYRLCLERVERPYDTVRMRLRAAPPYKYPFFFYISILYIQNRGYATGQQAAYPRRSARSYPLTLETILQPSHLPESLIRVRDNSRSLMVWHPLETEHAKRRLTLGAPKRRLPGRITGGVGTKIGHLACVCIY